VPGTNVFPIACNGGQTVRIALGAPAMGLIMKAMVVQLNPDGTGPPVNTLLDGFNYTFYNSAVACPPGTVTTAGDTSVSSQAEAQGQVSQTFTVPNNKDRWFAADGVTPAIGLNIPYLNCDGGLSNAKDLLYVKLVVGGSASENKTFGVFMGIGHYRG
jgi:hypothetical protein